MVAEPACRNNKLLPASRHRRWRSNVRVRLRWRWHGDVAYAGGPQLRRCSLQNKGPDDGSAAHWKKIILAGEHPTDSEYGIVVSQPHAMHLADINGDGIKDLVTGKRYWAHNGHGPDEHTPLALYWYETRRINGKAEFIPHLVDADKGVGVGTDVQVGDLNGDKLPDILVANKAGVFVMFQERKDVSAAEVAQMEPKKCMAGAQGRPTTRMVSHRRTP